MTFTWSTALLIHIHAAYPNMVMTFPVQFVRGSIYK
uniref:Uncharacterized protein n=1 Tax=Anguilla anguilla TaxID=7936 RepID=A0A0E9XP55_ANGAN